MKMKNRFVCWLVLLTVALWTLGSAGAEGIIRINGELAPKTREEALRMVQEAAEAYFSDPEMEAELRGEITEETVRHPSFPEQQIRLLTLTHDGHTMRGLIEVRGEPDADGRYPLYLALHGGGEDEPEGNDGEWYAMYDYYRENVQNGIYIAVRGISNTWDLHFQPESYPLYDRLIQSMIYLYHADPNRVYLMGFSAGGDGVYQITPRMADRFAAANMSSGHPNGVQLINLMNVGFSIQVGIRDYYTEEAMRCVRAAEFDQTLADLHSLYDYGYEHQVLVHVPDAHNYDDYTDASQLTGEYEYAQEQVMHEVLANPTAYADPAITGDMLNRFVQAFKESTGSDSVMEMSYYSAGFNEKLDEACWEVVRDFGLETKKVNTSAVWYVNQFTRNPVPAYLNWDLSTRAPSRKITSFYWLKADPSVNQGLIFAIQEEDNGLVVDPRDVNGDFSILVNPAMLDVSQPIRILTGAGTFEVMVNPSEETLRESIRETGDPNLAWVAEISYERLISGGYGQGGAQPGAEGESAPQPEDGDDDAAGPEQQNPEELTDEIGDG